MFDRIMEGRVNEIGSDLSSPEEDKDKKKEDKQNKPVVPLSNPIAMYYELNPPLEMMMEHKSKSRRSTSRRRLLLSTASYLMISAKR